MNTFNPFAKLLIPLALCISCPTFADTEFDGSVPLEVVMQFVGRSPQAGEAKLYSDILDAFPPFTVPADFAVLASADQGFSRRVILKTQLESIAAGSALREAFAAEGWEEIPQAAVPQVGFVNNSAPQVFSQLCHDDHGLLFVAVSPDADARYVNITQNLTAQMMARVDPTCAELTGAAGNIPQVRAFAPGGFLNQYVPRMVLPTNAQPGAQQQRIVNVGSSGGSDEADVNGVLVSDWNVDQVFAHFAEQIADQGWEPDTATVGEGAGMGSWTKRIDAVDLLGTLLVLDRGNDNWDLRFRLVRQVEDDAQ